MAYEVIFISKSSSWKMSFNSLDEVMAAVNSCSNLITYRCYLVTRRKPKKSKLLKNVQHKKQTEKKERENDKNSNN